MKFLAISTFNAEGRKVYGERMMESFRRHWPEDVSLRVYSEGWDEAPARVHVRDLVSSSPWLSAFKERHKGRKFKDFRWDAVRFAHKVAAVCHAARTTTADVLIWLDGDIYTHAPVSIAVLEELAPKGDEWIAWLDRDKMYPECGYFMLNCRHPRHMEMIDAFQGMYEDDKLFSLPEWHDSFVLQHVVESSGICRKSLSGAGRTTSHPLINGPIGKFADHLKGNRKREGRSRAGDLKIKRGEAYWQQ